MGFISAIGAFNAVTSFGQTFGTAVAAGNPLGALGAIFGFGSGGDDTQRIIDRMEELVGEAVDDLMDSHARTELNEGAAMARSAMNMLKGHAAKPGDYDRNAIIETATMALDRVNVAAADILEHHQTAGTVTGVFSALSMAMQARILVADVLQDGAFGLDAVSGPIQTAASLADRAGAAVRDLFTVDIAYEMDWGSWLRTNDNLHRWTVTSDVIDLSKHDDIFDGTKTADHRGFYLAGRDELFLAIEDSERITFADTLGRETYHGRIDPNDAGHRAIVESWIREKLAKEVFEEFDFGPSGAELESLGDRYRAFVDGEEVLGDAPGYAVDDRLGSGDGNDFLNGKNGDDTLESGRGDDVVYGGSGDDDLDGAGGRDVLRGRSGDDFLEGGAGDDVLDGGVGADILLGGTGEDRLDAGAADGAADTFVFLTAEGTDTLLGFEEERDTILLVDLGVRDSGLFDGLTFDFADAAEADGGLREQSVARGFDDVDAATHIVIDGPDVYLRRHVDHVGEIVTNPLLGSGEGPLYGSASGGGIAAPAPSFAHFASVPNAERLSHDDFAIASLDEVVNADTLDWDFSGV